MAIRDGGLRRLRSLFYSKPRCSLPTRQTVSILEKNPILLEPMVELQELGTTPPHGPRKTRVWPPPIHGSRAFQELRLIFMKILTGMEYRTALLLTPFLRTVGMICCLPGASVPHST